MNKDYDFLVVGAGFFGAAFARVATDLGKKCLVIDKRDHIAGTAYDYKVDDYYVSKYGAHIFHTSSEPVWAFVQKFAKFNGLVYRPRIRSEGKVYSFPINLLTLQQLYGVSTPEEAKAHLASVAVKIAEPANAEEWLLSTVGEELYRRFYYGYTKKQWLKEPRELPMSIVQRIPIRLTYDDNYFTTQYQGFPIEGYSNLVRNMLDGIKVELSQPYTHDLDHLAEKVIYSGTIDEYYNYWLGELEYRTLNFVNEDKVGDFQGTVAMNSSDLNVPYIRSIEHRHYNFLGDKVKHYNKAPGAETKSVVTYDYPIKYEQGMDPFYPIRDRGNSRLYALYSEIKNDNVVFGGRLGSYRYLDMDQSIASAMSNSICYLIIGTSRSGSSAVSGATHTLGVSMGEYLMPGLAGINPKGFYEDIEFVQLHDALYGSSFFSMEALYLSRIQAATQPYKNLIKKRCSQEKWGVKIPTMVFGIKEFYAHLVEFNCDLKIISMQRPINHSARSMLKILLVHKGAVQQGIRLRRTKSLNLSKLAAEIIGFQEVTRLDALEWANKNSIPNIIIEYKDVIEDAAVTVRKIANFCDITDESLINKAIEFIDPSLRHEA